MRSTLDATTYNGFELSHSIKNDQGFYREILWGIESLLEHMVQRHGSVFFTMFVLTYPSTPALRYPDDNTLLSRFLEALARHCKRKKYDPKYLWVREYSTTGQVHYHFMLLLNADYIQNAHGVLQKATELWQRCLNIEDGKGYVHLCDAGDNNHYGGVKIRRNDTCFPQVFNECFQRASYLAKCYSKGSSPAHVNEFGGSRLC